MPRDVSIEFDRVADLYDRYVSVSFDLPFWLDRARESGTPRLELMCGTGRITLPILEAGLDIEGLDYSAGLLDVFRHKLAERELSTTLHHADARDFALEQRYGLIFIGFHALAEVVEDRDKCAVLDNVRRHLRDDGRFWVSVHNPVVRRATLDGTERSFGTFALDAPGRELEVLGQFDLDQTTGVVTGFQRYRITGESDIELPVRFHLIEPEAVVDVLRSSGFSIVEQLGDYDGSSFRANESPFCLLGCEP